eukprot:scaffold414_cov144-Pinguiococcus_pyrenoidosus.AAC.3
MSFNLPSLCLPGEGVVYVAKLKHLVVPTDVSTLRATSQDSGSHVRGPHHARCADFSVLHMDRMMPSVPCLQCVRTRSLIAVDQFAGATALIRIGAR